MVEALAAVDNPLKVAPDMAPCVACHTSTLLFKARGAGVDPRTLRNAYLTSRDVSIPTSQATTVTTLRALGYVGQTPLISRRVAHETAQVLTEIEQRFP